MRDLAAALEPNVAVKFFNKLLAWLDQLQAKLTGKDV